MFDVSILFYEDATKKTNVFPSEQIKIDSLSINKTISRRLNNLYEFGYLAASHDVLFLSDNKVEIQLFTNSLFELANLSQGNVSDEMMNKIGFDTRNFNNRPFSYLRLFRLLNSILDYAENNGYPFASVKLDSISIHENKVGAWLNYRSGPMVVFDSLNLLGFNKVKRKYLMSHLGIYEGKSYEKDLVTEIPNKIKILPFISLSKDPEITISSGKCVITLHLAQNKASNLDGILGVLPNQKNGESVLFTGQINLDLHNIFLSGKRIAFEWQSYDANSQLLDILYYHPNLLQTPINIQGDFHLLKQDTSFLNREFAMELSFLSRKSNKIGIRTEFIASRLISTSGLEDINELSENADFNLNYYGLNYRLNKLNDINIPTRGWQLSFNGSIGQKKILQNSALDEGIYNDLKLNTMQYKFTGEIEKIWPIYKNFLFRTRVFGGYLGGDNLFQSDLFRIGGLQTLRGFVENQFYTSSYGIGNLELRVVFSGETYFMIFYDQGVLTDDFGPQDILQQYPLGTGAGFSFSTNSGIFNIIFAMGKSNNQPFEIDYSKIHFGYTSRF